jgi:hypothetical protein
MHVFHNTLQTPKHITTGHANMLPRHALHWLHVLEGLALASSIGFQRAKYLHSGGMVHIKRLLFY